MAPPSGSRRDQRRPIAGRGTRGVDTSVWPLYYTGEHCGVSFNEESEPSFVDFAYMSFTIGMTFQVSDADITIDPMRRCSDTRCFRAYSGQSSSV